MRSLTLLVCLGGLSSGQSVSHTTFEVASVRMYPPGAAVAPGAQGFQQSPDGFRATHITLRGCLQWAYDIVNVEGPDWITNESYDIAAKAAGPVSPHELKEMMQNLLEERFQIKVRHEMRDALVGVLAVSKSGVKNLEAVDQPSNRPELRRENGRLYLTNASMGFIAIAMSSPLGNMPMEKVVDQTGLQGQYNLTLDFTDFDRGDPQFLNYREMRDGLFEFASRALEKGYGLKLEKRKLPTEFLVVESGNKTPSAN